MKLVLILMFFTMSPFLPACIHCQAAEIAANEFQMLGPVEWQEMNNMLSEVDLHIDHTEFYRDWDPSTKLKSKWHTDVLQKGVLASDQLADLRGKMANPDARMQLKTLAEIAWGTGFTRPSDIIHIDFGAFAHSLNIKKPQDIFSYLEHSFSYVEIFHQKAFSLLSKAQADTLSAFCMQAMIESEDSLMYRNYFARKGLPWLEDVDPETMAPLMKKIQWEYLSLAMAEYQSALAALQERMEQLKFTHKKPLLHKSRFGWMIIGTMQDDIYSPKSLPKLGKLPICSIIDPAGNDVYQVEFATSALHPFYLLLDRSGDDVYRSTQPSFYCNNGLGISIDDNGKDLYQLHDFSFASVLGMNLHIDKSGDDVYQGGLFSQGAAILGISILSDIAGNDQYSAHAMSQAFGSTLGAGLLADYEGADQYYLGGRYFHAPLMPNDYRTMGQGMGFGMRPSLAGGLGFLYDKSGNDKYIGGVYAQGVGYWYATGILMDESGNDVYNAIYYPQGSGIHLASGILYDGYGDDTYYSRNGPGQGAGHDWAFGMLIDNAGNDAYSIQGGQGLGLSNSLGIFIDKSGDDRYERNEAQNYGSANFTRSTGGIGLFLDLGGKDIYPSEVAKNDSTWFKGSYGIGRDANINTVSTAAAASEAKDLEAPLPDAPIAEIFAAASEWEVGNAIKRVKAAREIMLNRHEEMAQYILQNKLRSTSGLEQRALDAFTRAVETFPPMLLTYVNDADSLKAKTAISLLAGISYEDLQPHLAQHLAAGRYLATCISALGYIKTDASLNILLQYKDQPNERLRFILVRAIQQIGTERALACLNDFKDDKSFLIQALIRKQKEVKP